MGTRSVFKQIGSSKIPSNFTPSFPIGRHTADLLEYRSKESDSGLGTILESEFVVVESDTVKPGTKLGWPWFIGQSGWAGKYAMGRAKQFIEAVAGCFGETSESLAEDDDQGYENYGEALSNGELKGLRLVVEVTPKMDKGVHVVNGKGEKINNATWFSIEQTTEEIQERAGTVEASVVAVIEKPAAKGAASAPPAAAGVQQDAASGKKPGGILSRLKKS